MVSSSSSTISGWERKCSRFCIRGPPPREPILRTALRLDPGDYRLVIEGRYRDPRGKTRDFTRRGPVLRVRDRAFVDSLQQPYGAPHLPAVGIPVGVLIIPQPRRTSLVDRRVRLMLRQWVAQGGRLLVTHDMAGIRGLLPVVPEVCRRGTGFPGSTQWQLASVDHPAITGLPSGLQSHACYDHITLEPGPDGAALATDEKDRPVLVVGAHGQGRYAALGLISGLAPGDIEVAPTGAERLLVESLVAWMTDGL